MDPIEVVNVNQQDNQQEKTTCGKDNNNSSNEVIEIDIHNSDGEMCIDVENVENKQQGQDNSRKNQDTLLKDGQHNQAQDSLVIVASNNNDINTNTNDNINIIQEKEDQVNIQPDKSSEVVKNIENPAQVKQVSQIGHEKIDQQEKESIIIDEDIEEQPVPSGDQKLEQENNINSSEQEKQVTTGQQQQLIQAAVSQEKLLEQQPQDNQINIVHNNNEQIQEIIPEDDESDEEEELRQLKAIATTCSVKTSPHRSDEGSLSQEKKENLQDDGEVRIQREIPKRTQNQQISYVFEDKHTLKSSQEGGFIGNIPYKFMNKTKESDSVSHDNNNKEHNINRKEDILNHGNHSYEIGQKKKESSEMELEVHSSLRGEQKKQDQTSLEENKEQRQLTNNNHIDKPNSQTVKSICEAPQSIASIFSQLAGIFSKMIIPQSMINMSLHTSKDVKSISPADFKLEATLQEQMNQLQNQVTYIQSSVVDIPKHLQEVTDLLGRTVPLKGSTAKASINEKLAKSDNSKKSVQNNKSSLVGNGVTTKKTEKAKETSSEEEDEEDQSDNNSSNGNSDADEDSSDDAEDQETIKALTNLSSKLASNKSSAVTTPKSSVSSSLLNLQSLAQSKKTSYIQPKVGFIAPKLLSSTSSFMKTPSKSDTLESSESNTQAESTNNVVINAASIGFREPKLFINESEQLTKSDDIEIEDESLKGLYEHLNKLDRPSSFVLLKEQFTDLDDQQIQTAIDSFKESNKIGVIRMFLPAYSKSQSARIEYYYLDMLIPPPKPKEEPKDNTIDAVQPKQHGEQSDQMEIQNIGDRKKYESMTDEQLLSYQKELNLRKQALLDKKLNANPTTDRIKKIQHWNEMKEVCSTIYERIAVLKQKTINEVCEEFGVQLDG